MAQWPSVGPVPKREPRLSNLRRDLLQYLTGEEALKDRDHDWVLEKSVLDLGDILLKTHVGRSEDHFLFWRCSLRFTMNRVMEAILQTNN